MKNKPFVTLISAALVAVFFAGLKGPEAPLAMPLPTATAASATLIPAVAAPVADHAVRLETVTVRPSAADIAAAMAETDVEVATSESKDFGNELGSVLNVRLPNATFTMPYYSFGRALPRLSSN